MTTTAPDANYIELPGAVIDIASGDTVTLPPGTITLTAPLRLADLTGSTLRGDGTTLVYAGPPTRGVVELARCNGCTLRDVEIVVAAPSVEAAVLLTNLPAPTMPTGRISTGNYVENVQVRHAGKPTAAVKGFSVDSYAAGGVDGNNDLHTFRRCTVEAYTRCGFHVRGSQCMQLTFEDCRAFDAEKRGGYGAWFENGVYFRWVGGGFTFNDVDFMLGSAGNNAQIVNVSSEHSKQFLVTDHTGGRFFLDVVGCRWDGEPTAGRPVVDCFGPGPWSFRSSYFAGILGVCPTLQFNGYAGVNVPNGAIDVFGVMLRSHGGPANPGVIATCPVRWEASGAKGFSFEYIKADGSRTSKLVQWNRVPQ